MPPSSKRYTGSPLETLLSTTLKNLKAIHFKPETLSLAQRQDLKLIDYLRKLLPVTQSILGAVDNYSSLGPLDIASITKTILTNKAILEIFFNKKKLSKLIGSKARVFFFAMREIAKEAPPKKNTTKTILGRIDKYISPSNVPGEKNDDKKARLDNVYKISLTSGTCDLSSFYTSVKEELRKKLDLYTAPITEEQIKNAFQEIEATFFSIDGQLKEEQTYPLHLAINTPELLTTCISLAEMMSQLPPHFHEALPFLNPKAIIDLIALKNNFLIQPLLKKASFMGLFQGAGAEDYSLQLTSPATLNTPFKYEITKTGKDHPIQTFDLQDFYSQYCSIGLTVLCGLISDYYLAHKTETPSQETEALLAKASKILALPAAYQAIKEAHPSWGDSPEEKLLLLKKISAYEAEWGMHAPLPNFMMYYQPNPITPAHQVFAQTNNGALCYYSRSTYQFPSLYDPNTLFTTESLALYQAKLTQEVMDSAAKKAKIEMETTAIGEKRALEQDADNAFLAIQTLFEQGLKELAQEKVNPETAVVETIPIPVLTTTLIPPHILTAVASKKPVDEQKPLATAPPPAAVKQKTIVAKPKPTPRELPGVTTTSTPVTTQKITPVKESPTLKTPTPKKTTVPALSPLSEALSFKKRALQQELQSLKPTDPKRKLIETTLKQLESAQQKILGLSEPIVLNTILSRENTPVFYKYPELIHLITTLRRNYPDYFEKKTAVVAPSRPTTFPARGPRQGPTPPPPVKSSTMSTPKETTQSQSSNITFETPTPTPEEVPEPITLTTPTYREKENNTPAAAPVGLVIEKAPISKELLALLAQLENKKRELEKRPLHFFTNKKLHKATIERINKIQKEIEKNPFDNKACFNLVSDTNPDNDMIYKSRGLFRLISDLFRKIAKYFHSKAFRTDTAKHTDRLAEHFQPQPNSPP